MTDPKIWGPHAWKVLHTMAYSYPENPTHETQLNMERFIKTFAEVLPCATCKEDFRKYLLKFPLQSKSKKSLVKWMVDAHNHVNKKLGKKLITYSEAEKNFLKEKPDDICVDCNPTQNTLATGDTVNSSVARTTSYLKIFQFLFFILFVIFLLLFLNAKYKFVNVDLMRFFHKL